MDKSKNGSGEGGGEGGGQKQSGRHRECETITEKQSPCTVAKDGNGNEQAVVIGLPRGGGGGGDLGGVNSDAGNTGSHVDLVTGVSVRVFQWVRGMNFGCRRKDGVEEKR